MYLLYAPSPIHPASACRPPLSCLLSVTCTPTCAHLCPGKQFRSVRPMSAALCSSLRPCSFFSHLCSCRPRSQSGRGSFTTQCTLVVSAALSTRFPKTKVGPSICFSMIDKKGISWWMMKSVEDEKQLGERDHVLGSGA